jgi:hypothetical protein
VCRLSRSVGAIQTREESEGVLQFLQNEQSHSQVCIMQVDMHMTGVTEITGMQWLREVYSE